jgi:glycerol kinase
MGATLLALDQGTTSTRAMAFDARGREIARHQIELAQHYPRDGWVEHDADEIARAAETCIGAVLAAAGGAPACLGITNQRETTVLWDKRSGRPLHRAIVWQDRRGAEHCRRLIEAGHGDLVRARTGLVPDSYFSATKLAWLLDNVEAARARARRGELAFGTIDSFLLWRLTGGAVHATDATNASRTMLFDIERQRWDDDLLALFDIPAAVLPEVRDSAGDFGRAMLGGAAVPVTGIAGDQQAALFGQACFAPGLAKATFGTGAFVLENAGARRPHPGGGLLATVAYRLGGAATYAVEGAVFNAGTAIKFLRDNLGLVPSAAASEAMAASVPAHRGVFFVPAFTGLGAPHWDPAARGAIFGLARDTSKAEIVHAALDALCFQTRDLMDAFAGAPAGRRLRVDGGMAANDWLMQRLADLLGAPVERPALAETTALGAAFLAALGRGVVGSLDDVAALWHAERRFEPGLPEAERERLVSRWRALVARVRET